MIAIIQGGDESEAEVSRMTSKSFQEALISLNQNFQVIEYGDDLVGDLQKLKPDLCLLALHGRYGEDGVIQGVLEHLRIPYTGSGVFASSLSFDKAKSQTWAGQLGVPVLPHIILNKTQSLSDAETAQIQTWPDGYVVKPLRSGSSRGVSLCTKIDEMKEALNTAFKWCDSAMVEKRLIGREITVALLKGKAFKPIEIRPKTGFYDMKNKYTQGATDYLCPAPIGENLEKELQKNAEFVYQKFGLKTYGRADFLVTRDESEFYFMEINTLPGCTKTSLLPKALMQSKIPFEDLIKTLIDEASLES